MADNCAFFMPIFEFSIGTFIHPSPSPLWPALLCYTIACTRVTLQKQALALTSIDFMMCQNFVVFFRVTGYDGDTWKIISASQRGFNSNSPLIYPAGRTKCFT